MRAVEVYIRAMGMFAGDIEVFAGAVDGIMGDVEGTMGAVIAWRFRGSCSAGDGLRPRLSMLVTKMETKEGNKILVNDVIRI